MQGRIGMKTVLVVDDEKEACRLLRRFLENQAYRVQVAHNGKEAMEAIRQDSPDCVLMDIKMPVMGGDSLLAWIRKEYQDLPVIVMTGVGEGDQAETCLRLGVRHFLLKPLDLEQLKGLIHETIGVT